MARAQIPRWEIFIIFTIMIRQYSGALLCNQVLDAASLDIFFPFKLNPQVVNETFYDSRALFEIFMPTLQIHTFTAVIFHKTAASP